MGLVRADLDGGDSETVRNCDDAIALRREIFFGLQVKL